MTDENGNDNDNDGPYKTVTCQDCGVKIGERHAENCSLGGWIYLGQSLYPVPCPECGLQFGYHHPECSKLHTLIESQPDNPVIPTPPAIAESTTLSNLGNCVVLTTFIEAFLMRYQKVDDMRHIDVQLSGMGTAWVGSVTMSELRALKARLDVLP